MTDLVAIARSLFAKGKGLLAADESVHTATARLASYGIATSPEMRRQYRDLFLGTEGIEAYLSGAILFSETLLEKGHDKKLFPTSLADRGIAPGVKVDLGTEPLGESPEELITNGLLDLPGRLAQYKKQGAVFTKWRAVIRIDGDQLPSAVAIHENVKRLASYAREVQLAGLVPILEPEVLYKGRHSRTRARIVIGETLQALFSMLEEHSVDFREVLANIRFVRPHIRMLLQKAAHRSLQQRVVIAAFDERVTDGACRPIAYALSNYARHCVRDEVLRRISPNHIVLRAKITHRSRHTFLHSLMFETTSGVGRRIVR